MQLFIGSRTVITYRYFIIMTINLHSLSENSVIDSQTDIKFIQILAGSLNVLWLPQFHRETVPISAYDIYMYIIMAMHTAIARAQLH